MTLRFLFVLVLSTLLPSLTFAQDDATKAQAREQFNQGLAQYESSQYDAALESFQEAFRLSPHPLVRVNMANCYDRLGKPVEALFHFEHFLADTENDRSRAAQRSEVESAIKRLKKSVGELNLRVIPDGSMVRVDETEERRAPITEPIRLAAGDHVVTVTRAGFTTRQERVQIRGGQAETINITLDRQSVNAAAIAPLPVETDTTQATTPEAQPEPSAAPVDEVAAQEVATTTAQPTPIADMPGDNAQEHTIFTPPVIIAGVISGTLLIGSALMAMAALKADADHEGFTAQSTNPALSMREQAAARRAAASADNLTDSRTLAAEVLLGGALIAGAAAVIFVVTQKDGGDPDLALQVGPGSVGLRGSF